MSKEPLKVLTESMFYVLLSLLRQDRCGTEIVQYVDDTTAGRVSLGPGTLYTILAKFEEEGLRSSAGCGCALLTVSGKSVKAEKEERDGRAEAGHGPDPGCADPRAGDRRHPVAAPGDAGGDAGDVLILPV